MNPAVRIRKLVWSCSCHACNFLNLVLATFALGQTSLVLLNFIQHEVPVPDKLTSWVINQVGPEDLEAEWGSAVFDLRAGVLLSRFTLRNASTEQIIATARETHFQLSPLHLLLPNLFPIRTIEARDVELYIPVSHSPSGLNEPVLQIKHVAMNEDQGQLLVSSLIIESGNIQLHLNGSAPIHLLTRQPKGNSGSQFHQLLQSIRRVPGDISAFGEITWNLFPSGDHLFRISGLLPSFDYSKARLSSLSGNARIRLSEDGLSLLNFKLDGYLALREEIPELPLVDTLLHLKPVPFHLSANGPLHPAEVINLPSLIQLNLHPRDDALPFHHLLLRTSYRDEISSIHWIASSPRAFSEGWALPLDHPTDPSQTTFPFQLKFRGYLPDCSLDNLLPELPSHRLLENTRADLVQLNASFDPTTLALDGTAIADGLTIGQTHFSRLYSRIHLDKTALHLEDTHVHKSVNEFANGSYRHHFNSSKFSLNTNGSILPTSLDIILGKWWTKIFTHIVATEPLPADVTVWGAWRDRTSLQSVTSVDGNNGTYRGVDIPGLQLRVRSKHGWTVLEHLRATFADGSLEGKIAIQSGLTQEDAFRALILDLNSDAPWTALCAASGIDELCDMSFEKNPHVTVRGTLWQDSGKGYDVKPQADLHLRLSQHEGRSQVKGLELEGLTLTGRLLGSNLDLSGLTGQFAGGVFAGGIRFENWQSPELRRQFYDLQLIDAHFGSAKKQLSEAFPDGYTASQPLPADIHEGRMDAVLRLQTGQALPEAKGNGSVTLREASLGQIHLFGDLSRFFSSMGLGFSSLELDSLTFDWLLGDSILRINNGLVTGPALRLQLAGAIDLATKELAMQADVTLVKGMIGMVLLPVSENLQFDLTGTIENPNWKIRFSPFRWLQDQSTPGGAPSEL